MVPEDLPLIVYVLSAVSWLPVTPAFPVIRENVLSAVLSWPVNF
jgi:hypothetical protein